MSSPAPVTTSTDPSSATPAAATTASTTKTKKTTSIKAVSNFSAMINAVLVILAGAVVKGLTGNTAFPTPPVDLTAMGNAVTQFTAAIQATADGGKTAKAVCEKQRKLLIADLKLLVVYVQNNCNNDMETFMSSGFQAQTPTSTANQPTGDASFQSLDFGPASGQVVVVVKKVTNARVYFVRYALQSTGAAVTWTTVSVPNAKQKAVISGLTPGATYQFQVQALGATGYGAWSDSSTFMCV